MKGLVGALWRYPVKSLLGEKLTSLEVDSRGVVNDRVYAVSDHEGKLGSGKDTRRFVRIDGLLSLASSIFDGAVCIHFPDGSVISGQEKVCDARLSEFLGQKVILSKEHDISHFDDGSVHIITSTALDKLQSRLRGSEQGDLVKSVLDERRFRANIVMNTLSPISDDELVGKVMTIGNVQLKVTHKTERCRMIALKQGGLEGQPAILKAVASDFDLNFGVYASVVKTGTIKEGDQIDLVG